MIVYGETTAQVARRWGLTPTRVAQMIRAGALPAEKLGRDWVIIGYPLLPQVRATLMSITRGVKNETRNEGVPETESSF